MNLTLEFSGSFIFIFYSCVLYVSVCTRACEDPKRVIDSLELELKGVVSDLTWRVKLNSYPLEEQ